MSPDQLAELLPLAEAVQRAEAAVLARMAAGESLMDMLNLEEHLRALAEGRPSRLKIG